MKCAFAGLLERHVENRIRFIEAELELALTFCVVAESNRGSEFRERRIANAELASHTAAKALTDPALPPEAVVRLQQKLLELIAKLEKIRED